MTRKQTVQEARLSGALKRNPGRYAGSDRLESGIEDLDFSVAPDHLDEHETECWFEIAQYCIPSLLKYSDVLSIEVFATLLAEFRAAPRMFPAVRHAQLFRMFEHFGMTPLQFGLKP